MKNSKLRRILLTLACAVLLVSLSVGATLAYLTSTTQVVENTFTVGNVKITLDEAEVTYDPATNVYSELATRTEEGNQYKVLPGVVIAKDPTVTVVAGSENCYVRAFITVSSNQLADELMTDGESWVNFDTANWKVVAVKTLEEVEAEFTTDENDVKTYTNKGKVVREYEVRYIGNGNPIVAYNEKANTKLPDIFTTITVPATIDESDVQELATVEIDIIANAIQSNGFNGDVDAAWAAFDVQN